MYRKHWQYYNQIVISGLREIPHGTNAFFVGNKLMCSMPKIFRGHWTLCLTFMPLHTLVQSSCRSWNKSDIFVEVVMLNWSFNHQHSTYNMPSHSNMTEVNNQISFFASRTNSTAYATVQGWCEGSEEIQSTLKSWWGSMLGSGYSFLEYAMLICWWDVPIPV